MAEPITRPYRVGVTKLTGHRWRLQIEDGNAGVSCVGPCERCEHGDAELIEGLPLGMDPIPVDLRVEIDDESGDWGEGALSAWLVATLTADGHPALLTNARRVVAQNQMGRTTAAILTRALDDYEAALTRLAELEREQARVDAAFERASSIAERDHPDAAARAWTLIAGALAGPGQEQPAAAAPGGEVS